MKYEDLEFANMSGQGVHDKVLHIAMPYLNTAKILVAGAGQGSLEYKLLKNGIRPEDIHSVDWNPDHFLLKSVNVRYCDLNGPLPFESETFGVCFATEVIEHLYNPHNLINETWRVLKPSGMLFLTTPNVHSIMPKIRFLFSDKLA